MKVSPFHWRGQPSIFVNDPVFNGVRTKTQEQATKNVGGSISLTGSNIFLAIPKKPVIAYTKA